VWSKDSDSLVCCTDLGDILVMDYLGKLKIICSESPRGMPIHSITCFDRGIIVGGADGFISTFGGTNDHDPYKEMQGFIGREELLRDKDHKFIHENNHVTSLQVSANTEDVLYFLTRNNQLMKVNVALDGSEPEEVNFEYVHE
jgi:hypothetical protein